MADSAKPMMLISVGLMVLGGVVGFLVMGSVEPTEILVVASAPSSVPPAPVPEIQPRPVSDPANTTARAPGSQPGSQPGEPPRNRMTRDLKREQIWSALDREHHLQPAEPGSAAPSKDDAAKLPQLDPQYIKDAIAEQLVPVAIECYETALDDDPELAGKLVAEFTIVGAEDVGGIVEDASMLDESTLDNAFVRECMRESLMAVTFEPPADGGSVLVRYPFVFESEP